MLAGCDLQDVRNAGAEIEKAIVKTVEAVRAQMPGGTVAVDSLSCP